MQLTLDEAERRAYMAGDTTTAALYGALIEGEYEASERAQHFQEEAASQARLADSYMHDWMNAEDRVKQVEKEFEEMRARVLAALRISP